MADTKISALTEQTTGDPEADELPIVDASLNQTKRIKQGHLVAPVATSQSGTSYTIDNFDDLTTIVLTNASQVTVTIPTDATDDLRDGFRCMLFAAGAGGVTLSTSGITLLGSSPNTTIAQNEGLYLEKTGTANTWLIVGGTSA